MSLYNIVSPASLVPGQPEDVSQVLANFQAIQAVLNGGIDDVNIRSTAAIVASKLAGYPSNQALALRGDGSWTRIAPTRQIFASGSGTYTTPAGVKVILAEVWGAGGAGGGAPATGGTTICGGSGGGGGGFTSLVIAGPAATYAYAVGAGGVPVSGANGGNGGSSTFGPLTATGGTGGGADGASSSAPRRSGGGGIGGVGSGGDLNLPGQRGFYGVSLSASLGVSGGYGGPGGSAPFGGVGSQSAAPEAGAPGGGGAGSFNSISTAAGAGIAGAAGLIVVWEFY